MIKAAGRMGWSEKQFWLSTPSYFFAAFRGHQEQERDRAVANLAAARLVAYYAVIPHINSKRSFKITDILTLPGEEPPEIEWQIIDPADMERFNREADEIFQKQKNLN